MEANHQGPLTPPRSVEEKPITVEDSVKESVVIKDVKLGGTQAVALEEESRVADIPGLVTSQSETGSLRETPLHTQLQGKGWIGFGTLHSL